MDLWNPHTNTDAADALDSWQRQKNIRSQSDAALEDSIRSMELYCMGAGGLSPHTPRWAHENLEWMRVEMRWRQQGEDGPFR